MDAKAAVRESRIIGGDQADEAVRKQCELPVQKKQISPILVEKKMGNQQPPGFTGWKSPAPASRVAKKK